METLELVIKHLLSSTEALAKMGAIAAWVFFTLVLLIDRFLTERAQKKAAERMVEVRLKDLETDAMMATAVEKLSDQIKELRYKIKCGGADAEA